MKPNYTGLSTLIIAAVLMTGSLANLSNLLSDEDLINGFKEALQVSSERVVEQLGVKDAKTRLNAQLTCLKKYLPNKTAPRTMKGCNHSLLWWGYSKN